MSKIKLGKKQPTIDMTPMVDLFMLLLTFFMLTTSFLPPEAVQIETPESVSEKQAPDKNVITISIAKDNRVFFDMDNGTDTSSHMRRKVLKSMTDRFNIKLSVAEVEKFEDLASFGFPMKDMKKWLNASSQPEKDALQVGMPMDSLDNQLELWIRFGRLANPNAEAAIKGAGEADYKVVKKILDILQSNEINKFNLTTNMEKVEININDFKK